MLQLHPQSAVTQVIPPFRSSTIYGGDIDLGTTIVVLASLRIRERIV